MTLSNAQEGIEYIIKSIVTDDEELDDLVSTVEEIMKSQDPDGCGKANHVTGAAGLEFHQVITEDLRK